MSHTNYIDPERPFKVDRIAFDKGVSEDWCGFTVFLDKNGEHINLKRKGKDHLMDKMVCTENLKINNIPINLETMHQPTFGYPFTEIFPQEQMKCKIDFGDKIIKPSLGRDIYIKEIVCRSEINTKKEKSPEELVQDFKKLKQLNKDIQQEIKKRGKS